MAEIFNQRIEELVYDLLATIHRDGGHYTCDYGLKQSLQEAIRLSIERLPENENVE